MLEQRQDRRRHLIYNLTIENATNNQVLGKLADISHEGLMLIGNAPTPVGEKLTLRIINNHNNSEPMLIELQTQCMWSKQDVNPDYYISGFHAEHTDLDYQAAVDELLMEIGFKD